MATYVLIHGAWHGGWCWRKVTPLLRSAGHEVWVPTLTGLGERSHLAHAGIDLSTHIQDVVNVLHYEDLDDVLLVGHSSAGMVITGVAHRVPERCSHLVYLDAFVPGDGQSLLDLIAPAIADGMRAQARDTGDGWRVPFAGPQRWGVTDAADVAWMNERLAEAPLQHFTQPVECGSASAERLPRTYIYCPSERPIFAPFAAHARANPATWRYHELATGHDAMVTAPRALADLLLELTATIP